MKNFPGVLCNFYCKKCAFDDELFFHLNEDWDIDMFKTDPEMSELLCMAICQILMIQNPNLNVHLGEKESKQN